MGWLCDCPLVFHALLANSGRSILMQTGDDKQDHESEHFFDRNNYLDTILEVQINFSVSSVGNYDKRGTR